MTPDVIKSLLQAAFPDAVEVIVTGEGAKFQVTVVSEEFASLRPVAKQQRVYAPLNEHIASGAIHAVTMRTLTPEEWRKAQLFA
ncbi:BolA family protein [Agitococcus lubricus]|uniref:Acid stress-induced BolA-like protein IbaG/YrbA n=1 Tax=Agitococcus lubricus TaxID=1077255 RepID=A0A2T5J0U1_9GAMM|nr:BolA family protein [Agitococcus lubricus]PTQ89906.1 acid stress-induced BolA-like protein IbaG/YrbA [Agitococcus lubricus]